MHACLFYALHVVNVFKNYGYICDLVLSVSDWIDKIAVSSIRTGFHLHPGTPTGDKTLKTHMGNI